MWRVWLGTAFICCLASLWLVSTSPGSHRLVQVLEWPYPPIAPETCPEADAIAVLAGTGLPRNRPLMYFETPNRMDGAMALYQAKRAPALILTTEEGELNRIAAIERGVPPERILLAGAARNTAAEARIITDTAMRQNWHRLLLVTSAFHMGRSLALIHRAAAASGYPLTVIPYPVDWQQVPAVPKGRSRWLPNRYGVELLKRTIKEFSGMVFYFL